MPCSKLSFHAGAWPRCSLPCARLASPPGLRACLRQDAVHLLTEGSVALRAASQGHEVVPGVGVTREGSLVALPRAAVGASLP